MNFYRGHIPITGPLGGALKKAIVTLTADSKEIEFFNSMV